MRYSEVRQHFHHSLIEIKYPGDYRMKNIVHIRYDVEDLREYICHTLSAIFMLSASGLSFEFGNHLLTVILGIFGLFFAASVIQKYHATINSIDEIEGFFSHFGLIFFIKFALCFGSGITFAREQFIESIAALFIISILCVMMIFGYRDMLREINRNQIGEYNTLR